MDESCPPTLAAAHARIAAVQPASYARTRNALNGAVSGLSPYITHGLVTLTDVLDGVASRHRLNTEHKFVFELGWRAYFRHVWHCRGDAILGSLHEGPLPDEAYAREVPADIRQGCTGVPVIDKAVRALYDTGTLHNHARMWLASYVVHVRKVHWRCGADWLYGHLLDGDLASNHLSWQWVAGTASRKPYLFNAENVARYAPASWHSPGSIIDASYESLDQLAHQSAQRPQTALRGFRTPSSEGLPSIEPTRLSKPPAELGTTVPDEAMATTRDVWLVHPWNLSALPPALPADTLVIGLFVSDFHRAWPWNERRWRFVGRRMEELAEVRWHADASAIAAALRGARSVRSIAEPHLAPWLAHWAACESAPSPFPHVEPCCDSFSRWWTRVRRSMDAAERHSPDE